MSKSKPVQIVEDHSSPRALIIGGSFITAKLTNILSEYGCQTITAEPSFQLSGKFDYIFLFDRSEFIHEVTNKYLKPSGKFLFVKTENFIPPPFVISPSVKILKIGDTDLWNVSELSHKILKVMFSGSPAKVIDMEKVSNVKKIKPSPAPPSKPVLKISSKPAAAKLNVQKVKTPMISTPKVHKTFHIKRLFFFGLIPLSIITIILGSVYWYITSLNQIFSDFKTDFAAGNFVSVKEDLKQAKEKMRIAQNVYDFSYKILLPFRQTSFMQDAGKLLLTTNNLLTVGEDILSSFSEQEAGFTGVTLTGSAGKITTLTNALTASQNQINSVALPYFPKESFSTFLASFLEKLNSANQMLPVVEKLFTAPKATTYLVLFQNNMELRPTGGFIGSLGLVTVENGKILEFKILDVYDADGQLKGHVEPPKAIRKYLSQPNFFLRDSNFDPDFAASAVQAAWFLQKELGVGVDGVIGANLFFLQNLLRLTGPLSVPDFGNEMITFDNFFFKAQSFTQKDFFPGSTQKKDFLKAVTTILQAKITDSKSLPLFELLAAVKDALERKNILLYAVDPSLQKLIEQQGFAGRMTEVKCAKEENPCFADYLAIIEANLGVNKANYFVSKSVTIEKKISSESQITNIATLAYENKNLPEIFSGGTYVNYLRLFVPAGSTLLSVTLNGMPITPVDIETESYGADKTVFGLLVKVAPDNKAVVKVSYKLAGSLTPNTPSYQFFFQKQAGDKTSPLILSISKPKDFKLKPVNFQSTGSREEEIFYATDTSVDRIFAFSRNE